MLTRRISFCQQSAYDTVSQTILTKEGLITNMSDEKAALQKANQESSAKLQLKEQEIIQSESRLKALEDQLKCELAAKEDSVREAQEAQRERSRMEEEWRHKMRQMEEEISVLTQRNTDLQVRHLS